MTIEELTAAAPSQGHDSEVERRAQLREDVAFSLGLVAHYAKLGQGFAFIGDDRGLQYATSCATAHFKAALASLGNLREGGDG